jgi:hypothetical protein
MARPEGTYTSQVFNFGVDKNIPFGFVDVVFDRTGNAVGFEKDGKFYNLGEKLPKKAVKKELTSEQLSKKKDLLDRKLNLLQTQASNTNISEAERNRYIAEFRKTQDELSATEKSFLETQVREGKVNEAEAEQKAADTLRFDVRRLEERRDLLSKLGKSTLEVDNLIKQKNTELTGIQKPEDIKYAPIPGVPVSSRPFGGGAIPGMKTSGTLAAGTLPAAGGVVSGATGGVAGGVSGGGTAGGKGGKGGKGDGDKPPKLTAEERYAQALTKAQELYQMPDIIFKNIDSLKTLLRRFVDKELTIDQFVKEIQNDVWYRQNSQEIQARYIQLFNYEDLVNTGQARGTTNYEQEIDRIVRDVQAEARTMRGAEVDDADARAIAKDLYIFNQDKDRSVIRERIARFIKPVAGMIAGQLTQDYGGEALQNYQALQGLAKANGFNLADILPKDATGKAMTAQSTLQAIATGKLDVNRIAQDVRKLAAVGQSDFVKELLGQGYNLEDAYSPYKQRMADILEIDPSAINLRDPALMMAINKDGDMNLFDYERALRKDARWQYTERARNEATGVAMNILRNFGFQG